MKIRNITLLLALFPLLLSAEELRLLDWNILNYPGAGSDRETHLSTVIGELEPDLLVVQELQNINGYQQFLSAVLEQVHPGQWGEAPFHNSYNSDRGLYIREECATVIDSGWLDTDLRDIEWWDLEATSSGDIFRLYTLHLKASQGSTNENRRHDECLVLRNQLDTLPEDMPFIVAGDFNIYHSSEPAYQLLLSSGPGQLLDPIDSPGNWHDNPSFASIHTQCPRKEQFGGGSYGGMDDRFDLILVSEHLLDGEGLELLPETYTAYGNDGEHFNESILYGGFNNAVPFEIAEAIHEASDHIPILADIALGESVDAPESEAHSIRLSAWPNPFNPTCVLEVRLEEAAKVTLEIFNLKGQRLEVLVHRILEAGRQQFPWKAEGQPSGLYLARLRTNRGQEKVTKLLLVR
ncbi:MAG: endonuclease/exonuclease/phosphatase family protein [Candidatus Krumholzibacteria bacterium]|jgi:endonuclease/exonuclease/phosphatase family metal-dependent hydrolase|nr:endonuclease/exonuclease/phosphatase family protein [Candidatus Krumholzibacteria bacterium]MDP6797939.1 endonuclease/exonuclease/phosphatase family protein [Candidatus Krumholzibacteria bacterium]MDP7021103.1 endonuclease/exonuclease/phosphatase family protein [Candidatus Krumholzibacteria bacterium]